MDVLKDENAGGRVQVSTEVISNIARIATLEIKDVKGLSRGNLGLKGFLYRVSSANPVTVNISGGVAEIDVCIIVDFATKVRSVAKSVQENVKSAVQNMTGITVAKVNVIISGITTKQDLEQDI